MPSWKALVHRPKCLIKGEGVKAQVLKVRLQKCFMKAENFLLEQISVMYLNRDRIIIL